CAHGRFRESGGPDTATEGRQEPRDGDFLRWRRRYVPRVLRRVSRHRRQGKRTGRVSAEGAPTGSDDAAEAEREQVPRGPDSGNVAWPAVPPVARRGRHADLGPDLPGPG